MTSKPGKQTISIDILPSQTMKFDQLIDVFLKKPYTKCGEKLALF